MMTIFENLNTISNVLLLVLVGVWVPLFIMYYFKRLDRRKEQYMLRDMEEMRNYQSDRNYKMNSRNDADIEGYLPKLLEEIPYRTSKEVSKRIFDQINTLIKEGLQEQSQQLTNKIESYQINENNNSTNTKQLIREIAHSLNTPLSQIEASAEILTASSEADNKNAALIVVSAT